MSSRGFLLPLAAALALSFALFSIARTQPRRAPADPPVTPPIAPFETTIAAVGLVEASSENVAIGTHLTGIVERVHVVVGARVRRGDLLFALDARHLEAEVAARRAALAEAREHVESTRIAAADAAAHLAFAEGVEVPGAISRQELSARRFAAEAAAAAVEESEARVQVGQSALDRALVERQRSEVRASIDGVVKVDVRPGEAVLAGALGRPLILLGETAPLHVRVDVDEHDAWRVDPAAGASASLRGQAAIASRLGFVRFEPYVTPKRSLTGDGTERVDTRVLQVIYRLDEPDPRWFVGQQVDVFIDGTGTEILTRVTER
jgi:multidrug efflux pump subunit AcrA (membrane-fusion protein)